MSSLGRRKALALIAMAPFAGSTLGQTEQDQDAGAKKYSKPARSLFKPDLELPYRDGTIQIDTQWLDHEGNITIGFLAGFDSKFHPGHWDNVPPYILMRKDAEVIDPLIEHLEAHGISKQMIDRVVKHVMDLRAKRAEHKNTNDNRPTRQP